MRKWSKILALSTGLLGVTTPVLMAASCKSDSPEDDLATVDFVLPNSVFQSVTKGKLVETSGIEMEDIYDTFIDDEDNEDNQEPYYIETDLKLLETKIQDFEKENGKITKLVFQPMNYMETLNSQTTPTFFYAKKGFWNLFPNLKRFSRQTDNGGEYGLLVTNFDKGYVLDDLPESLEEISGLDDVKIRELTIPSNLKSVQQSFNNSQMEEITIPPNLKVIENSFNNLQIEEITIAEKSQLNEISSSFSNNENLTKLPELPETLIRFNFSFECTSISEMIFPKNLSRGFDQRFSKYSLLKKVEFQSTPRFFQNVDIEEGKSPMDRMKKLANGDYEHYYDLFSADGEYREITFSAPQQIIDYIKIGIEGAYNSYNGLDSNGKNAEKAAKIKEKYPTFQDLINENNEDSNKPVTLKIYENDSK